MIGWGCRRTLHVRMCHSTSVLTVTVLQHEQPCPRYALCWVLFLFVHALVFRKLVCDPRVKLKYQHLITNSFVEVRDVDINALRRWTNVGVNPSASINGVCQLILVVRQINGQWQRITGLAASYKLDGCSQYSRLDLPCAGSGVRIDQLHFWAGCRTRRLNQALSVVSPSSEFRHLDIKKKGSSLMMYRHLNFVN